MREAVSKFVARAKVVATTFVTYAVLVSTVASGVVVTLQSSDVPGAAQAASWVALGLTYLASVVSIVRKVTQVPDDLVGLLLPDEEHFYVPDHWGDES